MPPEIATHPDFPAEIAVVIVAHNNIEKLPATVQAVVDAGCDPARIILVDVASTDGTGEWATREWPTARQIRLTSNDGPSPGRNAGIMAATARFVLLMDADVLILPTTIPPLYRAMQADASIKIGSPIVVHAGRPDTIQYAGGGLHYICEAVNPWVDRPLADRGSAPQDIGAAPTCALLLDRDAAIDVGLFDERYFIGKEDGDFTHRIKMAGYTIWEMPESLVLHHSRPRGTWLFYYQIRNRWHFILKNYEVRTIIAILPVLLVHEAMQFVVLVMKGHLVVYLKSLAGLFGLLPTLGRDRALANRIRRRHDATLLRCDPLVIRGDLASNFFVRHFKQAWEHLLQGYWALITRTVLAR